MIWAASLGACAPAEQPVNEVQREAAERQALIEAMERHPALQNQAGGNATGAPIDVPTTVPPKADNASGHEDHEDPQHPHRN